MSYLIDLAETKNYLGLSGSSTYDSMIELFITGSSKAIENYTGIEFVSANRTEFLEANGEREFLFVSYPPISDIANIRDMFNDGEVLDSTSYDWYPSGGMVFINDTGSLNYFATYDTNVKWGEGHRRYEVNYTGGYSEVPADVKIACLSDIAEKYNRRDGLKSEKLGDYSYTAFDPVSGLSLNATKLLEPYKKVFF